MAVLPERCDGCRKCESACQAAHPAAAGVSGSPRLLVVRHEGRFWPELCRHCAEAPCLDACVSGAMRRDSENGAVYVDETRCIGCWTCVVACPFGVIAPDYEACLAHKCDGCQGQERVACAGACEPGALLLVEDSATGGRSLERQRRRHRSHRDVG